MALSAWPLAYALFVWWFSTGVILVLNGLPPRTFKFTLAAATVVCGASLIGLAVSSAHSTVASAYCAFTCALLVWAWQEIAFLLGWVTGPRREACPAGLRGWPRAWVALQTLLYHEAALLVLAGAVLAVTWQQPNQTGWWTFAVLWAMRQSAKLNVFLGVRNLSESFLPPHLKYLGSYFARKPMNPLLPVSVLVSAVGVGLMLQWLLASPRSAFDTVSVLLVASLLGLAAVEHLFMVLPLSLEGLWSSVLSARRPGASPRDDIEPPRSSVESLQERVTNRV